jgi:hypothetical protein
MLLFSNSYFELNSQRSSESQVLAVLLVVFIVGACLVTLGQAYFYLVARSRSKSQAMTTIAEQVTIPETEVTYQVQVEVDKLTATTK